MRTLVVILLLASGCSGDAVVVVVSEFAADLPPVKRLALSARVGDSVRDFSASHPAGETLRTGFDFALVIPPGHGTSLVLDASAIGEQGTVLSETRVETGISEGQRTDVRLLFGVDPNTTDMAMPDLTPPPPPGPRLLAPLSTAQVTVRRPQLRWEMPPGATNPAVELCPTRDCNSQLPVPVTIDGAGTSAVPNSDLPGPSVVFWRVKADNAGVSVVSPTWEFAVGTPLPTAVASSWGTFLDLNGDGRGDFAVGAPTSEDSQGGAKAGRVYVYFGSSSLQSAQPTTLEGGGAGAEFGAWVASAGDVDGDGFCDLIVGAPKAMVSGAQAGRVFIFRGSKGGVLAAPWTLDAPDPDGLFGSSVSSAGDVNGDGYADIVVGAQGVSLAGNTGVGRAYVYNGGPDGPVAMPKPLDGRDGALGFFANSVSWAGDVNADGFGDIIIGSQGARTTGGATNGGRAYVYRGGPGGIITTSDPAMLEGSDGDQAFFGQQVVGAGDVDGDGYSDVAVAAPAANVASNFEAGRVYVFRGSMSGIVTPHLSVTDGRFLAGHFGTALAHVGDVNRDGRSELLIGEPNAPVDAKQNRGRAYVYFGGASGLVVSPLPASLDSRAMSLLRYGVAVSGPGDLTGEGVPDVVIGSGSQQVFIFPGDTNGFSASVPIPRTAPSLGTDGAFGTAVSR
jgi:hypothetical protein